MTRGEDVAEAVELRAAYVGVIFAGGPRAMDPSTAASILAMAGTEARRVGVFGKGTAVSISAASHTAGLDIIQLHSDPTPEAIAEIRELSGRPIWAVVRIGKSGLPGSYSDIVDLADAVVLDAAVPGQLGGTGKAFDWSAVARELDRLRRPSRLVLAGGLTPENVSQAISALQPDVVDVSSGVELSPGVKHPTKMRAFAAAVSGWSP
ncbi:MAG: phosphoribosylanthranilate isomerase [Anaerolineae bacterium]|nr:phosphoribosylanthranilate isomerase [Gemmatimonadaceae bacterium]